MRETLMRRTPLAALAGLLALGAAGAVAAAAPTYPLAMTPLAIRAWLPANSDLDPRTIISVGGGRVVSLAGRSASGGAVTVKVRTEIIDPTSASQAKALSEAQELTVDCTARKAKAGPMSLYPGRKRTGEARTVAGWDTWAAGAPGSILGQIIEGACAPGAQAAAAAAAPVAPPVAVAAAPLPAPAPPPPPPPPPPAAVETPAPAAPAPKAAPPRKVLPNLFVQIAAAGSRAGAEEALSSLRAALPQIVGDRPTTVEATEAGGQTFHRALIGGFSAVPEAQALCTALKAQGRDCLLRLR